MTQMEEYLVVRLAQTMAGTKADCLALPMAVKMVGNFHLVQRIPKADCLALATAVQMAGSSAQKKAGTKADCLA